MRFQITATYVPSEGLRMSGSKWEDAGEDTVDEILERRYGRHWVSWMKKQLAAGRELMVGGGRRLRAI